MWNYKSDKDHRRWMSSNFTLSVKNIYEGRYHTLLTSAFSHTASWHIAGNMLTLWCFGCQMIALSSATAFTSLYFAGCLTSGIGFLCFDFYNAYQAFLSDVVENRQISAMEGASGAISGILAWSVLHDPKQTLYFLGVLPIPAALLWGGLVGFDLYGMYRVMENGDRGSRFTTIAHSAHISGGLTGALWYLVCRRRGLVRLR